MKLDLTLVPEDIGLKYGEHRLWPLPMVQIAITQSKSNSSKSKYIAWISI